METAVKGPDVPAWFAPYAEMRADAYVILGELLLQPPSETLRKILQGLYWDASLPGELDGALKALRDGSLEYDLPVLREEYDRLFVGLGSGEMVPYASWYRERRIQSSPLAALRSSLMRLGIVRQTESHESEDHAGALCEIMALISQAQKAVPVATQEEFFHHYIAPWMITFFRDLQNAKNARFYRIVGRLGREFLKCESEYLTYGEGAPAFTNKGGTQNEERIQR